MPYHIEPPVGVNQDQAIDILEKNGVYGAVKKPDGSLRLYYRKARRIDQKTGEEIVFRPEELMTTDILLRLQRTGWAIVDTAQWSKPGFWRG